MRLLVAVLVLALGGLYFTSGLRLGYVTLTSTYMLNATGVNNYTFKVYDQNKTIGVRGSCSVRSGQATFRLTDSKGTQVAGQVCPKGQWGLNVLGMGDPGNYHLTIDLQQFTGVIDIKEVRN